MTKRKRTKVQVVVVVLVLVAAVLVHRVKTVLVHLRGRCYIPWLVVISKRAIGEDRAQLRIKNDTEQEDVFKFCVYSLLFCIFQF